MSRLYGPPPGPDDPPPKCRKCGKPGEWIPRLFGADFVHGEVLCEQCDTSWSYYREILSKAKGEPDAD